VLIEPAKGTRIGVTYVSEVKLDFSDRPSFSGPIGPALQPLAAAPPNLDLGVTVPQGVMFGIYQELSAKWAVMADVGWQNWHQFGEVEVGVDSVNGQTRSGTTQLHYQDTWHGALGAQYRYSDQWRFSGGVAYDTSAVKDADRSVVLPMGETWRFGLGAEWQASKKLTLGAAYEFAWIGNMSVDQGANNPLRGRVVGSYSDAWISFFTINLTYRF
jgi:long-chain fatty acid transport protein